MKVYVISHTHWDREWYKTNSYFNIKLDYFFQKLFKTLEEDDFTCFMLDGQMVMVDDYLHLHPEKKELIKQLVQKGKLIIGPWYTQPDEFIPDGESLIRNLLIGTNKAKAYGKYMSVGYLPDSFGQSAQMPHILKSASINHACIMRGVPVNELNDTLFHWESLNGDSVLTEVLPTGYSNGMFLPKDDKLISMRMDKAIKDLQPFGKKAEILLMHGIDHQFSQEHIAKFIKNNQNPEIEYIHTNLENYFKDMEQLNRDLSTLKGEMIHPVTHRVHTSSASTRIYQKQKNRKSQVLLESIVEPRLTLAYLMGATYPKEIINHAWELLLKNQIHDSICGCCTDEVHKDIDNRYAKLFSTTNTLINMHSRKLAQTLIKDGLGLLVFNDSFVKGINHINALVYTKAKTFKLEDQEGNEIKYFIEEDKKIDASELSIWALYLDTPCPMHCYKISFTIDFAYNYGYETIKILENIPPTNKYVYTIEDTRVIENDFVKVTINKDFTFNFYDKALDKVYKNLNKIEDALDAGDTYNFSPVYTDRVKTNKIAYDKKIKIKKSNLHTKAFLSFSMKVGKELIESNIRRSKFSDRQDIEIELTLHNDSKLVEVKTTILNQVKDHRIRVLFPTKTYSKYSTAETQFGTMRRPIEKISRSWKALNWKEDPEPIYSTQRFVDISDEHTGLTVFNKGLPEYEIYSVNNGIALTLLRGVGQLGKANLYSRPGRPSGVPIATPDAQCLGTHVFEYAILSHGVFNPAELTNTAQKFAVENKAVQNTIKLKEIEKKHANLLNLFDYETLQDQVTLDNIQNVPNNLISISNDSLVISSIKKSEHDDSIILRIYNPTNESVHNALVTINLQNIHVYSCNSLEETIDKLESKTNSFVIKQIQGNSFKTFKIK